MSVMARPFVAAHLHQAVSIMSRLADGLDHIEVIEYLNGTRTPLNVMDESSKKQQFRGIGGGIADELSHMFGHPAIRDSEGDFAIRVGTCMVFVRTTPDASELDEGRNAHSGIAH
jgi:hypothetical protein